MKKFAKVLAVALVCVMAVAVLVACAPNSDPDKAVKGLNDAGYTAGKIKGSGDVAYVVTAVKGLTIAPSIAISYYTSAAKAKEAWNESKDDLDDEKAAMAKMLGCDVKDIVAGCSGKVIYMGTKDAVKAAK